MADNANLAEDRTEWAEDRTILANERTFAAWMRTGMASVAVALGLRALVGSFEPDWLPKTIASIFVLVAVFIFFAARQSAAKTNRRMEEHATESQSNERITIISGALSVGAVATGVVLWLL